MIGKVLRNKDRTLGVVTHIAHKVPGNPGATAVGVATSEGPQVWELEGTTWAWDSLAAWEEHERLQNIVRASEVRRVEEMVGQIAAEQQADWSEVVDTASDYGYEVALPMVSVKYTIEVDAEVRPQPAWLQDGVVVVPSPQIDAETLMASMVSNDEEFEYDVTHIDASAELEGGW